MTEQGKVWGSGHKYSDFHLSLTGSYVSRLMEPLSRTVALLNQDPKGISVWDQTHRVLHLRSHLTWTVKALAANPENIIQESELQMLHDAASLILDQAESKSLPTLWEDPAAVKREIGLEVLEVDIYLGTRGFISLLSDRAVPLLSA